MAWSEAKGQYDDTLYGAEPRAKFLVFEPSRQHCHRYVTATLQKEPFLMDDGTHGILDCSLWLAISTLSLEPPSASLHIAAMWMRSRLSVYRQKSMICGSESSGLNLFNS